MVYDPDAFDWGDVEPPEATRAIGDLVMYQLHPGTFHDPDPSDGEPGTLRELRSSHLLEHFPQEELRRRLLPYWFSLLAPGGRFTAIVPDGEAMVGTMPMVPMPHRASLKAISISNRPMSARKSSAAWSSPWERRRSSPTRMKSSTSAAWPAFVT